MPPGAVIRDTRFILLTEEVPQVYVGLYDSVSEERKMPPIFKKLNLKDQQEIVVMNAPDSFEPVLAELDRVTVLRQATAVSEITFSLAFVTQQTVLDDTIAAVVAKAKGDALIWFAYPKKSSKRYQCEFDRDSGWDALGAAGFEGVRQVAIDEDWSALRFRRVEYIKSLQRDSKRAISAEGQKRTER